MNDKSIKNLESWSDSALLQFIGAFVKHQRLQQNKTQDDLATAAGISRSTLSLLERGNTVTLATLIQVLRILDQLHVLNVFQIEQTVSPLALAKLQKEKRQRARGTLHNDGNTEQTDW
ncbi:helix-turn-helix transcriptional regulator [Marnyiella aurantia]|uniref:Helix-turn-helix transcriptional regulator n=1 Tax=Marnyiella aurantia TaxID=2758037 RepID=A0A7D7LSB8_9FLAO|nr:helix-turn-helix transcriptional regulator [Marnyiella aurantia]MBA5245903.1 helix-turn-helix transcriptional regulator [Marnyiella aurantia]QMS98698.1 helix-turn-helix transcriptional regulator [Marnyiella aurantia]